MDLEDRRLPTNYEWYNMFKSRSRGAKTCFHKCRNTQGIQKGTPEETLCLGKPQSPKTAFQPFQAPPDPIDREMRWARLPAYDCDQTILQDREGEKFT